MIVNNRTKHSKPSNFFLLTILLFLTSILLFTYINGETIRSASEYDYPPYCVINEDSTADGFSVELLKEVLKAMDKDVSFHTGYWDDIKHELQEGKIDVLPLVGRTPEREQHFDFTVPYLPMHGCIVVRNDNTGIKSLKDLLGKRIAVMRGDNAEEFVRRIGLDADIITTPIFTDALKGLSSGLYDAVIIQRLLAIQLIHDLGITNLHIVEPPLTEFRQDFCFAVQEGNKDLLSILNEGLAIVIANGTFRKIYSKWFVPVHAFSENRILVGCDYNYPPWEYIDTDGNPAGYNVEITKAIARAMDLDVTFYFSSWEDIREKLENSELDIVQGMYYSPERADIFDISPPYAVVNQVIISRKGNEILKDSMLRYRKVIVEKSDIMHEYAVKNGYAHICTVNTPEQALLLLSSGENDCALLGRIQANHIINKLGIDNLSVGNDIILSTEYCYAVKKGNNALLAEFEEGLTLIKSSGKYRDIRTKWFGIQQSFDFMDFLKITAYIAIPTLVFLLILLIWSIVLRRSVYRRTFELQQEINARKLSEQALRERDEQYSLLFNTISHGILFIDRENRILEANPGAEKFIGIPKTEMLNPSFDSRKIISKWRAVDEDNHTMSLHDYPHIAAIREGKEIKNQLMGIYNSYRNSYIWILATAIPQFKHQHTQADSALVIFQDITELRNAEESMRKADRLNSLGVLAGGIAHDFNNLLTGIMGNLSILQESVADNPECAELAEQAMKASESAKNLVKQLLTFSKGGKPHIKSIDIIPVLEDSIHFILGSSDISYETDFARNLNHVLADSDQIQQVIHNIVINAKQALKNTGRIIISAKNITIIEDNPGMVPGQYVLITFSDNGPGIPPDIINKIFDPYFSTKPEGSGLGLAIVESVIRRHYGFLDVETKLGKGTTFKIFLPVSVEPAHNQYSNTGSDTVELPVSGSLLIMDDNDSILSVAERILVKKGFSVVTCKSGNEALEIYSEYLSNGEPFTAVILDLTVPGGMGGKETAHKILSMDPDALLIVSSGYSNDSAISEYRKYGFKGVVVKPYRAKELISEVMRVIRNR